MFFDPLRVDWNAIFRPSGDQAGAVLSPVFVPVVRRTGLRPSASITQSCDGPLAVERRAKAIFLPSGDFAGWASRKEPGARPAIPGTRPGAPPSAPPTHMRVGRANKSPPPPGTRG